MCRFIPDCVAGGLFDFEVKGVIWFLSGGLGERNSQGY